MKLGKFTIEQLSEGQFEIFRDGTINRNPVDEESGHKLENITSRQSKKIGINPILLTDGSNNILLDTGLGWGLDSGSAYEKVSNIVTNLKIFNLQPGDITHVILTHLHYDHAAGSSYTDRNSVTRPTFPKAAYYVQQREWDHALSRIDKKKESRGAGYQLDDLYRLRADGRLTLLDEDVYEVVPGVTILWTGGHTPGHQLIRIKDAGKSAYYLGDLLPSEHHLNHYAMRGMDVAPLQAKKIKIQLLKSACKENAFILFYHSLFSKVGRLEKDRKKKYVLKEAG